MELTFTGSITEIREPRFGTTKAGSDWANAEFEVTELNPQNPQYPQVALFDFFKNGEHVKYAKDFKTFYKLGEVVTVHFNLKKNEYTNAKNEQVSFYKTSAWKIDKQTVSETKPFEPAESLNEEQPDDLPF